MYYTVLPIPQFMRRSDGSNELLPDFGRFVY